jgi:Zn-dependent protease
MEHSGPLLAFTCRAWVTIFLLGKSVDVLTRRRFSRWLSQHHITWALGVFIYQHPFAAPNPNRAILQPAIERNQRNAPRQRPARFRRRVERMLRWSFEIGAYLTLLIGLVWIVWVLSQLLQQVHLRSACLVSRSVNRAYAPLDDRKAVAIKMSTSLEEASPNPRTPRAPSRMHPGDAAPGKMRERGGVKVHFGTAKAVALSPFANSKPVEDSGAEHFAEAPLALPAARPGERAYRGGSTAPASHPSNKYWYTNGAGQLLDMGLLILAIGLAVIAHELGHAVAASLEDVALTHLGLFVIACFPGAYIRLESRTLHRLSLRQQLRIYAAGCVQSLLLAVISLGMLNVLPLVGRFSGYVASDRHEGAVAAWIHPDSPWRAITEPESLLIAIDGELEAPAGYICLRHVSAPVVTRCEVTSGRCACVIESDKLPETRIHDSVTAAGKQWHCMVFEAPRRRLSESTASSLLTGGQVARLMSMDTLPAAASRLMWFDETPERITQEMRFSDDVQQSPRPFMGHSLLHTAETLLAYLFLVSLGLGLLNIIPALGLDGAHLLRLVVEAWIRKLSPERVRLIRTLRLFTRVVLVGHTLLLVALGLVAVLTQHLPIGAG